MSIALKPTGVFHQRTARMFVPVRRPKIPRLLHSNLACTHQASLPLSRGRPMGGCASHPLPPPTLISPDLAPARAFPFRTAWSFGSSTHALFAHPHSFAFIWTMLGLFNFFSLSGCRSGPPAPSGSLVLWHGSSSVCVPKPASYSVCTLCVLSCAIA